MPLSWFIISSLHLKYITFHLRQIPVPSMVKGSVSRFHLLSEDGLISAGDFSSGSSQNNLGERELTLLVPCIHFIPGTVSTLFIGLLGKHSSEQGWRLVNIHIISMMVQYLFCRRCCCQDMQHKNLSTCAIPMDSSTSIFLRLSCQLLQPGFIKDQTKQGIHICS